MAGSGRLLVTCSSMSRLLQAVFPLLSPYTHLQPREEGKKNYQDATLSSPSAIRPTPSCTLCTSCAIGNVPGGIRIRWMVS